MPSLKTKDHKFNVGDYVEFVRWDKVEVWHGEVKAVRISESCVMDELYIEYEILLGGHREHVREEDCFADEIEARERLIEHLQRMIEQQKRTISRIKEKEGK